MLLKEKQNNKLKRDLSQNAKSKERKTDRQATPILFWGSY